MKNWLKLLFTNYSKELIDTFQSIFMSIYFYQLTEGNLIPIIIYHLLHCTFHSIFRCIYAKIVNSKNVVTIYRISILGILVSSFILVISGKDIINFLYLYGIFLTFFQSLYTGSYETIISKLNEKQNYKQFFSINCLFNNIISIIGPVVFGLLLNIFSYTTVFVIVAIIASITLIFSLFLKDIPIDCPKLQFAEFLKSIKDKNLMHINSIQNIFDGLCSGGAMNIILSLLIYTAIDNETFLGGINSIASILSIFFIFLNNKFITAHNFKKIVYPLTSTVFLITIFISFHSSIFFLVLYMILSQISFVFTDIRGNTLTYQILNEVTEEKYSVNYQMWIQFCFDTGRIINYLLILIVYIIFRNLEMLKILFIIFSFCYVLRSFIIQKVSNMRKEAAYFPQKN